MKMIRSKICGFTRPQDALAAAQLGVDAVGLVFYPQSKRFVSIEQAQEIVRVLPPFVSVVALFVNENTERIRQVLAQVPVDILQFHGDETPEFCRQFDRPYIKAVRVQNTGDIIAAQQQYPDARAVLFDAHIEGEYGGTGHRFDWAMLPDQLSGHWILSGGLNPENIGEAVKITGAKIIDVSSGVESAPGIKSAEKIAALLAALDEPKISEPE
ncbi:MAG: phosphoribosylanthranilate isomerase [Neisseria sp.]|uniref:phosphoribosylanthranilate isomerase n=1 Tax=Neisseria sp. TaxID=192066 RepID=UPI0026DCB135|nr:phosphoribosylanthranilate isomerase [Neisseria sp.]MDO4249667.1 phosphoribosylanthranilate isomerase [Neisseria sp.]